MESPLTRRIQPNESVIAGSLFTEETRRKINDLLGIVNGDTAISPSIVDIGDTSEIVNPQENVLYRIGDTLVYWNGTEWRVIGGGGNGGAAVLSVNGDSGPFVTLTTDDIPEGDNKYVSAQQKLSLNNLSGINTGDETTASIQAKRPLKSIGGESPEGFGNIDVTNGVQSVIGDGVGGTSDNVVLFFPDADDIDDSSTANKFVTQAELDIINGLSPADLGLLKNPEFSYTDSALTLVEYEDGSTKQFFYKPDGSLNQQLTTINGVTSSKQFVYNADGSLLRIIQTP